MSFIKPLLLTVVLATFSVELLAHETVMLQETSSEKNVTKASVTTNILTLTESSKTGDVSTSVNHQVKIIQIKGTISKKLLANLKPTIPAVSEDTVPAGLIVLLDSKGGDGMAAIEIGRLLRKANAHVFVNGECSSACILVLAGGVVRGAPTFSVGIHQARVTLSSDAGVIKKEVNVDEDPQAKSLLDKFNASAKTYFSDMDISPELFVAMQSHPLKRVYRLSSPEITTYGLNGMESNYLMERAQMYAQRPGRWPKDSDELMRRTSKVSTECMLYDNSPIEFTKCYRKVLQDIY
jgi:ATP-dependent protease ClpP protease subunit